MSMLDEICEKCGATYLPGYRACRCPPAKPLSAAAVDEIIADLTDRQGCGWDDIDKKTQQEIRATWIGIIERHLGGQR